jgi:hypothetical protein
MATSKKVVLKPALTARVVCDQGHALTGLFVIFKLQAPAGESGDAKLARVVEATPHPGDPPAEPVATGDAKKDAAAKKTYKADKKAYDDALAKYDKSEDKTTPPDPADQYVLGIVDDKGFLQPVHSSYNPWFDIATGRDPDTYKLTVGESYHVCGLRHPSPALARALTRYLNRAQTEDDKQHRFDTWGTLTRVIKVDGETVGDGVQSVMKLSEKVDDFVPRGSDRYGGWLLYRDMPHQACAPLAEPVRKVQEDLTKLRYPVGDAHIPFTPSSYDASKNTGGFTGQVQAALARMQEHVQAGQAFVLANKAEAHAGKNWVYVLGEPFDAVKHAAAKWTPLPAGYDIGVADEHTAARIAHWVDHGLRKPSEILVESTVGGSIWMLERGIIALDAWSVFAEAFGVQYGVKAGSSLRSVLVGAWPGAILNSVHKTGLAVDLSGGAQRIPSKSWPIRYEAHWSKNERSVAQKLAAADKEIAAAQAQVTKKQELETQLAAETDPKKRSTLSKTLAGKTYAEADARLTKAKAARERLLADDDDGKFNWTQRWRLYGHSDLDVFGNRDAAISSFHQKISKLAGLPVPGIEPAVSPGKPRGDLWQRFSKRFAGVGGAATEAWLDSVLAPYHGYAQQLITMPAADLIAAYFRSSVVQWNANAYEGDGGSAGKLYRPTDGDAEFPAAAWAKSWVNLTAIAYPCQLERIGPHGGAVRDQTWIKGPTDPKVAPVWRSMSEYFVVNDDESVDIVVLLTDMTASNAAAPQNKQADTDVPVRRGDKDIDTYKPSEIDGDFFKQWRLEVKNGLDATLFWSRAKNASKVAKGAELGIVLAVGEAGKGIVNKAADLVGGKFAAKHFIVVRHGALAQLGLEVEKPVKGDALAAALRKALEAFIEQTAAAKREAEKKAADEAAAADPSVPKPRKTKTELAAEKKAAEAAARKLVDDWTVVVQPVFLHTPDPAITPFMGDDKVLLPPGSDAAHLEWWHYQHRSATPSWGELLEECGYSQVVMGAPKAGGKAADGLPVHRGLGYAPKGDLDSHPGGFNDGPVENRDQFTPKGS